MLYVTVRRKVLWLRYYFCIRFLALEFINCDVSTSWLDGLLTSKERISRPGTPVWYS